MTAVVTFDCCWVDPSGIPRTNRKKMMMMDDAVTSNRVLSKVLIASNPCFFFWQADKTGGSEIMLPDDEDIEDLDLKEAPDTETVSESLIIFPYNVQKIQSNKTLLPLEATPWIIKALKRATKDLTSSLRLVEIRRNLGAQTHTSEQFSVNDGSRIFPLNGC
ncbi:hypothetical protein TNIN_144401 [Trichonephila inaurata madagascariensis]|uniref:Uncharacterized protein n=1 Tax=Trichonephila inaurata madagascariensis TaxID=2747483 RepID=A0A8X6J6N6_9ARAC|nr:hypothetical protein TNIN_144401 [Trichonephila inaurata madagascariensis]